MDNVEALAARIEALSRSLNGTEIGADEAFRDELRQEIVSIGRSIDEGIRKLERMKEGMRPLVARYQSTFPRPSSPSPTRADHLGSSTYRERGWSALAGGSYAEAIQHLRRAMELDPGDVRTISLLAWAQLRLEQLPQARILLSAASAEADHPFVLLGNGYLALKEGEHERAIASFQTLIGRKAERTAVLYAHLYLGMGYAQLGMHREAQAAYREALELGPSLTEAYWELGCSHLEEGRDDLALEAWRAGGENRFNPWGEQCRNAVQRLEAGLSREG